MFSPSDFSKYELTGWANKLSVAVSLVILFGLLGDSLLVFVGHCLHVLYESAASIVEHWLQASFHLTERQSEIVFFYFSFVIGAYLTWRAAKNVWYAIKRYYSDLCNYCRQKNAGQWYCIASFIAITLFSSLLIMT